MRLKPLLVTLAMTPVVLALLPAATDASAAPPNGVDHLRGRWDGVIADGQSTQHPFTLLLGVVVPEPNNPQAGRAAGCIAVGRDAVLSPAGARLVGLGNGKLNLTLFGTAFGRVIKLSGTVETAHSGVADDQADGLWIMTSEQGSWSATHHDRRHIECPSLEIGGDLRLAGDVYAAVTEHPDDSRSATILLESFTNIVSSGVRVDAPGIGFVDIPPFSDLFSPQVNFSDTFRYLGVFPGLPVPGEAYNFTLLDVVGEPIPGATVTDIWLACLVDAPRNVSATVDTDGIVVAWEPVMPVPGFDPSGLSSLGFYQIELAPEIGGGGAYGANGIQMISHLIPKAGFAGFAPGSPDGNDFGNSLLELADGTYGFSVIAFAQAAPGSVAGGLECQVRASAERVLLEKSGAAFTIIQ